MDYVRSHVLPLLTASLLHLLVCAMSFRSSGWVNICLPRSFVSPFFPSEYT
jgi:hypothetical protein